jgi:hypothetical protein
VPGLNIITSLWNRHKTDETALVPPASDRLMSTERVVGLALTLISVFLHVVFLAKAGGFWRDEANSISLALRPTLADAWSALKFDSFPILHVLVVRFWAYLFGPTDFSLRMLGFIVGILIIVVLWIKSRELGSKAPIISLLLLGMSPVMIRSLDSIRPNGIAAVTTILAFTVVWRAVQKPDTFRISMAALVLVLCVQTLYQSAIFVFAIGIAALSVGFLRGGFRHASLLAVPFIVAALSLVPYAGHLQEAQKWSPVAKNPSGPNVLLPAFLDAICSPTQWFTGVWAAVAILAVAGAIQRLARKRSKGNGEQPQDYLLLYCGITFITSLAGFLVFLVYVAGSISFQAWHVVPLLIVAAVALEPLVEQAATGKLRRVCYLSVVVACAVTILIPAVRNLTMRMTSMDFVASAMARKARPQDLVIVNPWYLGVSFSRYYRGSAPWMTFPGLQETALHRYDLLKERMRQPEAISEDIARISSTLQRGGRVWVVGQLDAVNPEVQITPLLPPPLPETGWWSGPYLLNWSQLLTSTLAANSHQAAMVPVYADRMINPLESPKVAVFQGWAH